MNKGFYKDLDTNFEQALILSERSFLHEELLALLKQGNIPEKQIAALKFDLVNNSEDAKALVENLTGCDGKIREAVALRINRFLVESPSLSSYFCYPRIFADASIDINANICRLVIDSVSILKKDSAFSKEYLNRILLFIKDAFEELDNFIFRDKKYVINKQLFKLYWCLESLKLFTKDLPFEVLYPILERASKEREYTVREKVAQILSLLDSSAYNLIKESLKNDENYYVRNAL